VNGPEILHLARRDLQQAIARRGKPPNSPPMDASPWVAMSAMQKAIRRGREDLAQAAAATLLRDAPEKLWRRIACVAYEDVGLASLETIALATAALAGKQVRAELGGEWAVASGLVGLLARAPKCRGADDLLMSCELHPAYAEARAKLPRLSTRDLIAVAIGPGPIHERALALWCALGTGRRPSALAVRRGEPQLAFDLLSDAGWPPAIVETAREGFRRTGETLCPLVALLACEPREPAKVESDDFPPEAMVGDAPSWTLDAYSREGRAAFARFLHSEAASARWLRRHVRAERRAAALGHIVFRVEGGLIANRMRRPLTDELRRQVDYECGGLERREAIEAADLVRADLPLLNAARADLRAGRRQEDEPPE
jgi:hypothetical protein